jgi:PTS system mannose-specific IIA component
MPGILLIGHRNLPETFYNILKDMTHSNIENIDFVNVFPEDNIEKVKNVIEKKIKKLGKGKGVLILTDMFGGTPSNLALTFLKENEIEVITGINLPMLLKLQFIKDDYSISELPKFIADYGKRNICIATNLLRGEI